MIIRNMTRILCLASGKGGVGKTTGTINLGFALMSFNQKVVIVDGNITTPNMAIHLGVPQNKPTLQDVLEGRATIENAIYVHPSGLRVVPSGISLENMKRRFTKFISESIINLIGKWDWILIDTPAGLGREARIAIEAANEVVIVTNPELPAVVDALKAKNMSRALGTTPIGVIINKVIGDDTEMSADNIASFLELPILASVPFSKLIKRSIKEKEPASFMEPYSDVAVQFKKAAAALLGEKYEILEKPTVVQRIKKLLRII
jgi:septum site-determining protein MinD